ncbi:hypothetical protein PUMCH_001343 [Australozyma saopauloensis]|uniref:Carboxypeptidase n=1 Tax=Australozyma saopauloensis TaxID=291208 RepID=A0AAX4H7Y6_9ASCO|nr:hypothetical protein PUMCH_001343 [[Candida] saopauloensis]
MMLSNQLTAWALFLLCITLSSANPIRRAGDRLRQVRGVAIEDFIVTKLPGLFENVAEADIPEMYAGQLPLDDAGDNHYFFWKFVDTEKVPDAENKTIFWFNGGPGCSSMDGALMEIGPLRVDSNLEVVYNNGSWHKLADLVFVDQPVGTGFSYGATFDGDMDEVLGHFMEFIDKYFELFPEDIANEVIIAGESYAGQYIPYFASNILTRNDAIDANKTEALRINLKGLMIGNGAIGGDIQSLGFVPFVMKHDLMDKNDSNWPELLQLHEECQNQINRATADGLILNGYQPCEQILSYILAATRDDLAPKDAQCLNMYDFTLRDSYPSCGMNWPPILPYVTDFLGEEEVREDIHIIELPKWKECNNMVHTVLVHGDSEPSSTLLPFILERIEVLLFWGESDIICNTIGGEMMVQHLQWGGQKGYSPDAIEYDWVQDSELVGSYKTERNLTFVKVLNASHMVAFDLPEVSRGLINLFMKRFTMGDDNTKPTLETNGLIGTAEAPETPATNQSAQISHESQGLQEAKPPTTSKIVRLIQLVVIIVIIWALCALYSKYKSGPVSIIKTDASQSSGIKKNVQWAEDLENEISEELPNRDDSFIARAYNLIRKLDSKTQYAPVNGSEIELSEGLRINDEFIIASDDEEEHHAKK